MSVLMCHLDLLYPPISNQEGDWLSGDEEVSAFLKRSKLYMIVQREELKFSDLQMDTEEGVFKIEIYSSTLCSPTLKIHFNDILPALQDMDSMRIEQGDKIIRIYNEDDETLLYWATPDKMLFDFVKGSKFVYVDEEWDVMPFQTFQLLYVGISKENDSFTRLFKRAHEKRLKILSNENTVKSESRLTDEVMMLLFEVTWANFNKVIDPEDIESFYTYTDDENAVVADAEKAFVHMLNSKYNSIKFKKYPECKDGLYEKELKGYSYSINYHLQLVTEELAFTGQYDRYLEQDEIVIYNDVVKIIKK